MGSPTVLANEHTTVTVGGGGVSRNNNAASANTTNDYTKKVEGILKHKSSSPYTFS